MCLDTQRKLSGCSSVMQQFGIKLTNVRAAAFDYRLETSLHIPILLASVHEQRTIWNTVFESSDRSGLGKATFLKGT